LRRGKPNRNLPILLERRNVKAGRSEAAVPFSLDICGGVAIFAQNKSTENQNTLDLFKKASKLLRGQDIRTDERLTDKAKALNIERNDGETSNTKFWQRNRIP
jgi:hypothetical protein